MQILFLGTSSMQPTKERNHTSILLSYKNEGILLDCGEGTQRQLKIAGIKPTRITKILITHWHGDHVLGLPGLIQTLGANEYNQTLHIYGPKGTRRFLELMQKTFVEEEAIKLKVHELSSGTFFQNRDFRLECLPMEHGVPCLGYNLVEKDRRRIKVEKVKRLGIPQGPLLGKLQRNQPIKFKGKKVLPRDTTYVVKGKKVSFIPDTLLCNNCYQLAAGADLLVSEAVYTSQLEEKAREYKHLTAKQGALIANQANVKRVILTHFSQRYKDTSEIEQDARDYFNNVTCAYDFMKTRI